ncbi:MAG: rhomboid family intramembrane serine protease [Proteobacteria bacterium]|nr:rhomboid family intramembrane serine protease [Pseudomonadota bacterium]
MNELVKTAPINPLSLLRTQWATALLITINLAVYVWMGANGVPWIDPEPMVLLDWGANLAALTLTGEYWRLLTSMFVHSGIIHLLLNMSMLLFIGPLAQKRLGNFGLISIYLSAGLVAGFVSASWYALSQETNIFGMPITRLVASIGASGALMGLAVAVCVWKSSINEHEEGEALSNKLGQVVLLNLGLGFIVPGVDQACHIGGLLYGFPMGLIALAFNRPSWKRSVMYFAIVAVTTAGVFKATQGSESEELRLLADEVRKQQKDMRKQKELEIVTKQRDLLHKSELAARPKPVSAEEASVLAMEPILSNSYQNPIFSSDGRRLYITDQEANSLTVVDVNTRKVTKVIKGPELKIPDDGCDKTCRGMGAQSVAISPDEKWALVPSMAISSVALIDIQAGAIVHMFKVGNRPATAVFSHDGLHAYVINKVDNSLSVLNIAKRQVDGEPLPLGSAEERFAHWISPVLLLSPDGKRLLASNASLSRLDWIDLASRKMITPPFSIPNSVRFALTDTKMNTLWLPSDQGLLEHKLPSFESLPSYAYCNANDGKLMSVSPDGKWMAAYRRTESGEIVLISRKSRRTVGVYQLSEEPHQLLFSPDGNHLAVLLSSGLRIYPLNKSINVVDYVQKNGELFCDS